MKKVCFLIFFALCISFVTAAQDVERRTLDTTVSRAYEEQILAQKLNTRLSNTAIKYEHDKVRPNWGYKNNNITYRTILEVVKELSARDWIHTIVIVGSASPVGSQQYNHDLAYERARILGQWVAGMPGGEKIRIYAISAGEDWETFAQQVHAGYDKKNRQEVLAIIDADAPNDEKESKLYNLDGGKTWQILVNKYMGLARNAAVVRVVEDGPLALYSNTQPFGNKVKPAVLILPQQFPTEETSPIAAPLKAEKSVTPKEEKVATPKAEKTATPKAEKTATPKEEKVAAPKAKKTETPKEEKPVSEVTEKPAKEKTEEEEPASEVTEKPAKEKTEKAEPVSEVTEKLAKEKTEKAEPASEKTEKPAKEKTEKEKPIKAKDTIVVEPRIPIVALRTNLLVPALNAGIEVPIGNHWSVGADYYFPWVWPKADNKNCFEFLGWGIEGRYWFGKNRTAYDRLKGHSVGLYGYVGYYDFERNFHGHQGEFVNVGVDYTYAMAVGRRKSLHLEFSLGVGYIYSEARQYTVIEANGPLISDKVTKKVGYFGPTKANVSLVVPIFQKVKPSNKAKGNE